VLDCYI